MSEKAAPTWWRVGAGVVLPVLVLIACGVILWASLAPVLDFVYAMLAGNALLILGVAWLVLTLIGAIRYRALWPSMAAPGIVLITAALVVFSVPFRLGFAVSKSALQEIATACVESHDNRRIGVYRVWDTQSLPQGCHFFTRGGLVDSVGIAYLPGGAPHLGHPRSDGDFGYWHIEGDWYKFVQQF